MQGKQHAAGARQIGVDIDASTVPAGHRSLPAQLQRAEGPRRAVSTSIFFGFFDRGTSAKRPSRRGRHLRRSVSKCTRNTSVRSAVSLGFAIDLARSVLAWKPFVAVKYFSPRTGRRRSATCSDRHAISLIHADSLPSGEYRTAVRLRETADESQRRVRSAEQPRRLHPRFHAHTSCAGRLT